MDTKLVVLIISPPGDLQIGLQALLTSHLDVDVLVVSEGQSASKVIGRQNPALVIVDQDIPGNLAVRLVEDIKNSWHEIICLILVNDDQSRQKFIDAGADFIIIKGLSGVRVIREVKRLLKIGNSSKGRQPL